MFFGGTLTNVEKRFVMLPTFKVQFCCVERIFSIILINITYFSDLFWKKILKKVSIFQFFAIIAHKTASCLAKIIFSKKI